MSDLVGNPEDRFSCVTAQIVPLNHTSKASAWPTFAAIVSPLKPVSLNQVIGILDDNHI